MHQAGIRCFRNLARYETLPFEKPVGTDHIPVVATFFTLAVLVFLNTLLLFLTIELQIEYDLLFNFPSKLKCFQLIQCHGLWLVQNVLVRLDWSESLA